MRECLGVTEGGSKVAKKIEKDVVKKSRLALN